MGEIKDNDAYEEELVDYKEDEKAPDSVNVKSSGDAVKKGYFGIHSTGFRDFLLKAELLRAIVDSWFEHPSEVQHECIPQSTLGMDVICQAKSGMGKTALFVLSTLQQIEPVAGQVAAVVLCHTRELPYQPMEIYDDEAKLTLHGLVQHYTKLNDILDALDFNQLVIFVKGVSRGAELNKLLIECNFPSICIHSGMSQEERLTRYKGFKDGPKRILVATDLVGRGIDIERANIVINYDMPDSAPHSLS